MDKEQARAVLADRLRNYRAKSYDALKGLIGEIDAFEAAAPDGTSYQIEIEVLWDHKPEGNLRILGAVDDGRWSAFRPEIDGFVLTPDGRFVGE